MGMIDNARSVLSPVRERPPGCERVEQIARAFKLGHRGLHPEGLEITIGGKQISPVVVGGRRITVIAGPCSVEGRSELLDAATTVTELGAVALRGGAYKPRTSPYSFQGLGEEGLTYLAEARRLTGVPVVTEVTAPGRVERVAQSADVLQIGARNMQNYDLLREVGKSDLPVLLKRGLSASIEEWLMAAEYVLAGGNLNVILCERGIRTFETMTRNTLDLSAVAVVKNLSHLPVLVDPSHATGNSDYVTSMALAALAAGADGLLLEVHPEPSAALCDGDQSLNPKEFSDLMDKISRMAGVLGRYI